jgi:O-methyltransferase involved in polyketide biosynthesis
VADQADSACGAGAGVGFDPAKPNVARIYDYLLGGKDHFAVDRDAAQQLLSVLPNAAAVARANRAFVAAAVRQVARAGVRQYVDVGAGLPTSPSVHECAREFVPGARVAYVDNDPVAVVHARALLATGDGVIAVQGDARDPGAILADPGVDALIDLSEPVCVLLVSMLHFFTAQEADLIVATFRQRMAPGSYLVISAGDENENEAGLGDGVQNAYGRETVLTGRPAAEIAAYFDGFDVLAPGLVDVSAWRAAGQGPPSPPLCWVPPGQPRASMLAGVGRKRGASA